MGSLNVVYMRHHLDTAITQPQLSQHNPLHAPTSTGGFGTEIDDEACPWLSPSLAAANGSADLRSTGKMPFGVMMMQLKLYLTVNPARQLLFTCRRPS